MKPVSLNQFYAKLDRAYFIETKYKDMAGVDGPLPIGFGQTISQPSLVKEMTRMLTLNDTFRVLEIGTGSGYQTAFLAQFAKEVYTVEIIPELADKAKERLDALGYHNISYKIGDGSCGWEENAPYDRIIATSAAQSVPEELVAQLKKGGIMIAPIGPRWCQELMKITKDKSGTVRENSEGQVVFVEMKGKYGWG